ILLVIYKPFEENENGDLVECADESFYFIDKVKYKNKTQNHIIPKDSLQEMFTEHLALLEISYNYFLQLVSFNISEKNARKKAGLKNELLYRLAIINHKIITNDK